MIKTDNRQNNLISFMQAYLLSLDAINQIMGIFLGKSDGIMIMNLIPIAALIAIHFFTSNKKRDLNMDKKALLFVYYIVSVIVVYKYAFRNTTYDYTKALVYCFIPIYLSFYKVNVEKILKYMMLFSALVLPISSDFFQREGSSYITIGMSTTYNILPFVVAAALHFWYYRKNASIAVWIGYLINIYYLIQVVGYGNRGPMVSLVVLAMLLLLHEFDLDGNMKKNTGKRIFLTLLFGVIVVYVVSNIEDIIISLNNWLNSMGIEISALSKSIATIKSGDLTNGRAFITEYTKKGIAEHYLVGNGISTIIYNSNGRVVYSHNLFYQLWYDLGVIVSIPMFWIIGKATFVTGFKGGLKKDHSVIMTLLYALSVPRLFFSTEFWVTISFWFLIMYTITPNIYTDESEKVEEDDSL